MRSEIRPLIKNLRICQRQIGDALVGCPLCEPSHVKSNYLNNPSRTQIFEPDKQPSKPWGNDMDNVYSYINFSGICYFRVLSEKLRSNFILIWTLMSQLLRFGQSFALEKALYSYLFLCTVSELVVFNTQQSLLLSKVTPGRKLRTTNRNT